MRERIAACWGGAPDSRQRTRLNIELIAPVIQAKTVIDLGRQQGRDLAPMTEVTGVLF